MSVIPCEQDVRLRAEIDRFADALKTQAHLLGEHGLDEASFYDSPIFRGAIEKLRGEFSATLRGKREFIQHVLNHLEDGGFIQGWDKAKRGARNDYYVRLNSGRTAVIDQKGCLDGANTNIFERPPEADEFVTWSLCTNTGADPRRNAWSGIHTRLSAEMLSRNQRVDGVVIWDMICGTFGRPCPKLQRTDMTGRMTIVGPFRTPPPCVYVLPAQIPSPRVPHAAAQGLDSVELLSAFHRAFRGLADEVHYVDFDVRESGEDLLRRTTIRRAGIVQHASEWTANRRV
ncbi:hypothetical protein LRS10_23680 [Phenylobacterium sp. J426]|uniref:hypothetical protein n=1 Tax=Phenylobacterium sp. J426 TaxID=2898439 RepID=UPI0021519027|nr:hypothetical protein [Phenylobacterium sp. J426]MCR5876891.1 hypothetical protein [Phenylobacterium sp. J426]